MTKTHCDKCDAVIDTNKLHITPEQSGLKDEIWLGAWNQQLDSMFCKPLDICLGCMTDILNRVDTRPKPICN